MQIVATDHLSLAIPQDYRLSYYEFQTLRDVNTLPHGIVLTMFIPLASSQTKFTVYEAVPLPIPQLDSPGVAIIWHLTARWLTILDIGRQTTTLLDRQHGHKLLGPHPTILSDIENYHAVPPIFFI